MHQFRDKRSCACGNANEGADADAYTGTYAIDYANTCINANTGTHANTYSGTDPIDYANAGTNSYTGTFNYGCTGASNIIGV